MMILYQNYPNPFNPVTTIKFVVPSKAGLSKVLLKVYDISGREVSTLINGNKSSGSYALEFDGTNFSSGIYYYELKTVEFIEVRKMMLLK